MKTSSINLRLSYWFPRRRFELDFPLVFWFAGLWLYLKSFLYLCYVYMMGIEPPPYSTSVLLEMIYFGAAMLPSLMLGAGLWQERKWAFVPAILFLGLDTPVLLLHVLRLAEAGFLDSGLTKMLELGSLVLNVVSIGWLMGYRASSSSRKNALTK